MQQIDDYKNIGQWIRQTRENSNMTQSDVAAISGYSNAYICRIETGKDLPRFQVIEDVFNSMGYKIFLGVEKDENFY